MNIPSGNITFLFTDIEGSTKLAQKNHFKMTELIEKHNSILDKAVESNNGIVFKTIGDAYCCSFHNAHDAVKAAVEAQTNLSSDDQDFSELKVRMGIHSGFAEWNGNDYMGYITLARSARIMSAANGGQILISNPVYEQLSNNIYEIEGEISKVNLDKSSLKISFRDFGERRLKDLALSVRLYQLNASGLREEFPPLITLDARPNNLPIQLTNFIGREEEIKQAKELLKDNRLLTLTGTGGLGKTRFSLQVAADLIDDFANGVWFVELAAVSDPVFLPITIINALGIKEEPMKTPEETLTDQLKDKEILIILDNCEQLIDASAKLTESLLSSCPKLKIIATSREALNCAGEQTYRIPPLTQPDPNSKDTPEQLAHYESVRLFIERALSVNPNFRVNDENAPALAKVCTRLDGIPLAIELAAARTKVLSVEKIFERLDDRFNLLTGGKRTALPRQQTLRALIDWSYDLLSEKEKSLWKRLTIFWGGWKLEAAEEICSDMNIEKNVIVDLLNQLSEKSIISFDWEKERYKMLETIKQYGKIKLKEVDEFEKISEKHSIYYTNFANLKNSKLSENIDMENFMNKIEFDLPNIDKANNYFLKLKGAFELETDEKDSINVTGVNYYNLGLSAFKNDEFENAIILLDKSIEIFEKTGNKKLIALSIIQKGNVFYSKKDFKNAEVFVKQGLILSNEIDFIIGKISSLSCLSGISVQFGDYENALKLTEDCIVLSLKLDDGQGYYEMFKKQLEDILLDINTKNINRADNKKEL